MGASFHSAQTHTGHADNDWTTALSMASVRPAGGQLKVENETGKTNVYEFDL